MTDYAMPKVGDLVAGKYRLDKVAGEGGMGIVYAAEHLVLRQRVAVKVLLPDAAASEAVVERFSREAQAAARIQSEHVARVMDAGSLNSGAPFLVMEYLEGCDLEELLELQGTLPMEEVVDYVLQALEALAHAHAVGIVHRDLKPANLFLACRPDGGNAIKIVDFGISKATRSRPEEKRLTGQHVLGSPVYMSPEQLRNAKEIDGRADLWSLGVVAYEMLTGRPPFDGEGVGEIFAAILEKEAEPVHRHNWRVPEELSRVIARCLERNPDDRWRDAHAMARALAPFGTGACAALPERIEQVLARAKLFAKTETPIEARRVVDAIAAAAERAKTTGSGTLPWGAPPGVEDVGGAGAGAVSGVAGAERADAASGSATSGSPLEPSSPSPAAASLEGRRAAPDARSTPPRRWLGVAAVAAIAIGAGGAAAAFAAHASAERQPSSDAPATAAQRSAREARPTATTPRPAVAEASPSAAASGGPWRASPGGADGENSPVVIELPDNARKVAPPPVSRARSGTPGKPQRPSFLKKRE
jgi:serine/threonine-protein kinase